MDPRTPARLRGNVARTVLIALVALAAGGCMNSMDMKVATDVPTPLVQKLPLTVGVYYNKHFRDYAYTENSKDRPNWDVKTGASQVAMFNTVLRSMFRKVVRVNSTRDPGVDGIIEPRIADMQFALPQETRSDLYEAWVKYKIQLYSPAGELLAQWPLTGYGKSVDKFLKTRKKGLTAAIDLALRDAGAKLALHFDKAADVKQWIASATGTCTANASTC
jgi:hypothetical protein